MESNVQKWKVDKLEYISIALLYLYILCATSCKLSSMGNHVNLIPCLLQFIVLCAIELY